MWHRIDPPPPKMPDEERARHASWRRHTRRYRQKRRLVRDLWIGAGLLMIISPFNLVVVIALTMALLSFAILDETP